MPKKRKYIDVTKVINPRTKIKKLRTDLNRPSLLIPLSDPEFSSKFANVFEEHVKGFQTKRLKSSTMMEWKQRLMTKKKKPFDSLAFERQKAIEAYKRLKKRRQ